ncbi:hypothetical protein KP509_04G045800 [Ceratopteris richardii]|nr:hypothetical protein KP509_04G045800 [Ceratopteris richardii]
MEGKTKSCIEYDLDAGHRCLQQERTLAPDCTVETSVENHEQHVQQERTHKSIKQVAKKKPGFFSVLSNFCIACLCPSSAF